MPLVATFLQISDLHIGDIDPNSGNATLSPTMVKLASNYHRFDGLVGHHGRGLDHLAKFYQQIRPSEGEFRVIVTGDLTRGGSPSEFQVARDYIYGRVDISPPNRNMVGLQLTAGEVIVIHGNHDHWNGSALPWGGRPSQYLNAGFPNTPFVERVQLANNRIIEFVGINSDKDVKPFTWNRFAALGKFQDELNHQVLQQLPSKTNNAVRILLVHHSWIASGFFLRMVKASKSALSAYLMNNGFQGLLTGHMHLFQVPNANQPNSFPFEEFRCGSSTQHDTVPPNWKTLGGSFPNRKWAQNSVLVHRIFADPGVTTWEAEVYERFPKGYASLGAPQKFSYIV